MAAVAEKLNFTAFGRVAAVPRLAALDDDEDQVAIPVESGGLGVAANVEKT